MTATRTATARSAQPRDDFFRICGVAAALIVAVVMVVQAPQGRPVQATLAAAPDATAAAATLLVASVQGRPLVDSILRSGDQGWGF